MSKARFICRLIDSFKNNHGKIAVIDQNGMRQTTYEELLLMSCKVAGFLQEKNLNPHSFIGICLPTCMEYIAAEIGVWLAGHAIVPMGDNYPKERIDFIMKHCESPLLIDKSLIDEILSTSPIQDYTLQDEDDINSIFYTSGSTGQPKGVIHTFATFRIPPSAESIVEEEGISTMGITAPMYFIACKLLYAILLKGGKADLVPATTIRDIKLFEDYVDKHQIEFVFIPPSVLPHFHNHAKSLKVVLAAAERLSNAAPEGYKIFNQYGLTETGGSIFSFTVDKAYSNTPIGKPETDVEYCILNEEGEEVRQNEEGELCVRGNFSIGYYKDSTSTDNLYRGGWLHTGDIVRQLPGGELLYVNRKDWMIKINGQRVEPGEVEAVIKQMDNIEDAIVKGFTTSDGHKYLCAYYVATKEIKGKTFRKQLSSKMPDYMIPAHFVQIDSIPKNANGKINRQALVSPASSEALVCQQDYEAPANETEKKLCEAFEIVLGIKHIGVNSGFFELGGDSINVMKLQTLCSDLPLSASMIFTYRTPKEIAKACRNCKTPISQKQNDYPLSHSQMGIYAACMARQGEVAYNNGILFHLGKSIDLRLLALACEEMVAAHPYIKTRIFLDEKGNPRQRCCDSEEFHLSVEPLSADDFETIRLHLLKPFNILEDRLFRIRIFQTPEEAYLFTDFHHIIFDGTSAQILFSDLNTAYHGLTLQKEEWTAFDVALEEEFQQQTPDYTKALDWNRQHFGDINISSLPAQDRREAITTFGSQQLACDFQYSELDNACKRFGVTPNVLTTAAFGYLLGLLNYANEALFATVYSGRKSQLTSRTVGMLVKTLAVHSKWNQSTTIGEFLLNCKNQLLESMNNDLYAFSELCAYNNHINSHILFTYQDDISPIKSIGGETIIQIPLMENATGEKLAIEIFRNDNLLTIRAEYHSNLYSDKFIQQVLKSFHQILEDLMLEDLEEPLYNISVLSDKEQKKLLDSGTGKQIDYDSSETFVDLFHRQALQHPHAIAVVDEFSSITYAELDRQSDLLATVLIDAGISQETFVGIMLPRKKEFVIAMLAVLKAGGAYVPLDPEYPTARLNYLLEDSQARLLITISALANDLHNSCTLNNLELIMLDCFDFNVETSPVNRSQATSAAYMIYTSGSTGKSKGVIIEHQGLRAMIEWMIPLQELKPYEKCAEFASFSFDASLLDICPPLVCGSETHIISSSILHEPDLIYNYFSKHQITGACVSTQLGMLLINNYDLPLRYIIMGGEKLHETRKTNIRVINQYGPTEFTVCSAYHVIDQNRKYTNIPIGRPVPNSLSVVLSTNGRLSPRGAIGELCLIGRQMARGYWNQPELTTDKFTPCPFIPDKMMYHTGDLVRWNNNGELEFYGRIDNQVKFHGFRIELEEIESKLCSYPGITSAVTIVLNHHGLQSLAGYYCATTPIDPNAIVCFMKKQLPDYMVPQSLTQISKMPLTPNGKIDRKKIAALKKANVQIQVTQAQPATRIEQVLYKLAQDLLDTNQFGVTDDLANYGLTSLAAIKFSMIAKEKGIAIKVNDILRYRNIRDIASQKNTIGYWESYSPAKPVIILIQGMMTYTLLSHLINALSEHASLYVIEPLEEHLNQIQGQSMLSNLKALYISNIKSVLPKESVIHAFVGPSSLGGALAFNCSVEWHHMTGQTPKIIMFDPFCRAAERKDLLSIIQIPEMIPLLSELSLIPHYSGQVVFFQATVMEKDINGIPQRKISEEEFHKMIIQNKEMWQQYVPQIKTYPIEAGHFSMLTEPYMMGVYLEKIIS